jgi:hypothetical protein
MWQDHFKSLHNSVVDIAARGTFNNRVDQDRCSSVSVDCVSVREVQEAILGQKKGESSGPNGLVMEAFIYRNIQLHIHLSLFYTFCIKHYYLPACFMTCDIVPLIKNKGSDLTDIDNYRAIV